MFELGWCDFFVFLPQPWVSPAHFASTCDSLGVTIRHFHASVLPASTARSVMEMLTIVFQTLAITEHARTPAQTRFNVIAFLGTHRALQRFASPHKVTTTTQRKRFFGAGTLADGVKSISMTAPQIRVVTMELAQTCL